MDTAEFGLVVGSIAATGAVEHSASLAVDAVSDKVQALRSRLRSWFGSHDDSSTMLAALETAEQNPNKYSVKMLGTVLTELAETDPVEAADIARLANEIHPAAVSLSSSTVNVSGNARVGEINSAGRDIKIDD